MPIQSDEVMFEGLPGGFPGAQSRYMQIHRNTAGGVPAAAAANKGSIYFDTNSNALLYSDGAAWAAIGSSGVAALPEGQTFVGNAGGVAVASARIIVDTGALGTITLSTGANGDIHLDPAGSGSVNLEADTEISGDLSVTVQKDLTVGAILVLANGSGSPANGDSVGEVVFRGLDSGAGTTDYSRVSGRIASVTAGSERGGVFFEATVNGTLTNVGNIAHTGVNAQLSVGDGAADAIVRSSGNFDLILRTGNATTGSITIADGANGAIAIVPNGVGVTTVGSAGGAVALEGSISIDGPYSVNDTPVSVSASGAISINKTNIDIDSTAGAMALTLADAAVGRHMFIRMIADGGDAVLTPTNLLGAANTITFDNVGDTVHLAFSTGGWAVMGGTATVA